MDAALEEAETEAKQRSRSGFPSASEQDAAAVAALQAQGVKFSRDAIPEGECSVIELPTPGKAPKYVAGFANFETITRYNRSTFYATAVLELADAISKARHRQITAQAEAEPATSTL
jgi:membrane-bound lytic murein transglycosylase B